MHRPLLLVLSLLYTGLGAQDCFYQIQLSDDGGDGWNGATVTVTAGSEEATYTLDAMNDDGASRNFFIGVEDGDEVSVAYAAGDFSGEVSFRILNNNDSLIYEVEAPETDATLTAFQASCRTCASPPTSSIELFRLRYNTVDVRFRSTPGNPTYRIEYGDPGFDPENDSDTEVTTQDTTLRIEGLERTTAYDFYVSTVCSDRGNPAVRRGPFRIVTPLQKDLGVTILQRPVSQCSPMMADSLTVGITNFGGEPQQFVRLDVLVNGEPAGVNFPFDGIYTGVIGVDSTEFFTFDLRLDLSTPGYYVIEVFTMLEGDENPANDRLTQSVVSLPVIAEFPYLQDFEEGNGFWLPSQGGRGPVSWNRVKPRGRVIDRAGSGEYSFVTNAGGPYNDDELSYLDSPCFNFSGLAADPFLSFLLSVDTETEFDGLSLEATTDGGKTWDVVERNPTGVNWYNNGPRQTWDGGGGFGGRYFLVSQQLAGLAGEAEVRFRFVFESDGDGRREGVSIDNIRITRREQVDYAAVRTDLFNDENCEDRTDTLSFTYLKLGIQSVDSVTLNYSLNGAATVSARAAAPQVLGQPFTFRFADPLVVNQQAGAENSLLVWVTSPDDVARYNDTITFNYPVVGDIPFLENFEDGMRPAGWSFSESLAIADAAGTPSLSITGELNDADTDVSFSTTNYGGFESADELVFHFRQRNAAGEPVTGGVEMISILLARDCDDAIDFLADITDLPADTLIAIPLGLTGFGYNFSFAVTHGTGDVVVSFDNVGVRRCPSSLDIRIATAPPSGIFADDGTAYALVGAGLPPYRYEWSNGDVSQSADGLSVADYSVTVTDAVGCTDMASISVDLQPVSTNDPGGILAGLEVFPNPTGGRLDLRLDLNATESLSYLLFNATGRRIERESLGEARSITTTVDLSQRPEGLYFLQVRAGMASRTIRVVKL